MTDPRIIARAEYVERRYQEMMEPPVTQPTPVPPEDRLAAIRQRLEAATEGPWYRFSGQKVNEVSSSPNPAAGSSIVGWPGFDNSHVPIKRHRANADFIAHSREDIPYLLGLLQEKERVIAKLVDALETTEDDNDG